MINNPSVSIIVPVYNASDTLEGAVRSLLTQSHHDIEIIIVNDASTDLSRIIIDRISLEDARIVPVHLSKNIGVHEARLVGMKKAAAGWIGFLDADDFARNNMFEVMYKEAMKHKADIVVCGSCRVNANRKFISKKIVFDNSKKIDQHIFDSFCKLHFGTGVLWNKIYSRDVFEPFIDLHFPWRQSMNEDLLLNLAFFYKAKSVYVCDQVLHDYVINPNSITSTINKEKAYVETYRACAVAIKLFAGEGSENLEKIIDLYRLQLSWGAYYVSDIAKLSDYSSLLLEATDLIYKSYPGGFAMLVARKQSKIPGLKGFIFSILRKTFLSFKVKMLKK